MKRNTIEEYIGGEIACYDLPISELIKHIEGAKKKGATHISASGAEDACTVYFTRIELEPIEDYKKRLTEYAIKSAMSEQAKDLKERKELERLKKKYE